MSQPPLHVRYFDGIKQHICQVPKGASYLWIETPCPHVGDELPESGPYLLSLTLGAPVQPQAVLATPGSAETCRSCGPSPRPAEGWRARRKGRLSPRLLYTVRPRSLSLYTAYSSVCLPPFRAFKLGVLLPRVGVECGIHVSDLASDLPTRSLAVLPRLTPDGQ